MDWRKGAALSSEYQTYREPFTNTLSEFHFMSDDHLGGINIAKHYIELPSPDTAPVHSAPYSARQKIRKFQKAKINKMIADKIIEPLQTEWAGS